MSDMEDRIREQMAEAGINVAKLNGEPLNPDIPLSRMYASDVRGERVHDVNERMFHLIEEIPYPLERIKCSAGRDRCYHCFRAIQGRLFFFPYQVTEHEFINSEGEIAPVYICYPEPFCRPECALTAHQDKCDLQSFFLMYGPTIQPAPPRSRLVGMGAISIEEFHANIDAGEIWTEDEHFVHNAIAPRYYSCIPGVSREITDSAKEISRSLSAFTARDADLSGQRENVYTIGSRADNKCRLGKVLKSV